MINLLPPHHKTQLAAEERFRLMAASGLALVAFLLAFVLLLLSVFLYLEGGITAQKTLLVGLQQAQTEEEIRVLEEIKEKNQLNSQIVQFYTSSLIPSLLLERLALDLPQGVYLTGLTLTEPIAVKGKDEGEPKAKLALTGRANTRELLEEFQARLFEDSMFEEVFFPHAVWVPEEDGRFTFGITMSMEEKSLQRP